MKKFQNVSHQKIAKVTGSVFCCGRDARLVTMSRPWPRAPLILRLPVPPCSSLPLVCCVWRGGTARAQARRSRDNSWGTTHTHTRQDFQRSHLNRLLFCRGCHGNTFILPLLLWVSTPPFHPSCFVRSSAPENLTYPLTHSPPTLLFSSVKKMLFLFCLFCLFLSPSVSDEMLKKHRLRENDAQILIEAPPGVWKLSRPLGENEAFGDRKNENERIFQIFF